MKIKYLGKEYTEVFGLSFKPGETIEVADPYAAEKLRLNPQFKASDAEALSGPPKAMAPTEALARATEKARLAQIAEVNAAIISDIQRRNAQG